MGFHTLSPTCPLSSLPSSSASSPHNKPEKSSFAEANTLPLSILDVCQIASDLVYWVRNAYNPVTYGFTSNLRDKFVKECATLCQNVGVEIAVEENGWEKVCRPEKPSKKPHKQYGGTKHRINDFYGPRPKDCCESQDKSEK